MQELQSRSQVSDLQGPTIAALCAVIAIIAALISRIAGHDIATQVGIGALLLAVGLQAMQLAIMPRILTLLAAAGSAVAFIIGKLEPQQLNAALFIGAFICASGMLRATASQSPAIRESGKFLVALPRRMRFFLLSIGASLLTVVLLIGALQLLAGLISAAGNGQGNASREGAVIAVLRGFVITPIISPIAIPFIVLSSTISDLQWNDIAVTAICIGISLWVFSVFLEVLAARRDTDTGVVIQLGGIPAMSLLRSSGVIVLLVLSIVGVSLVSGQPLSNAALLVIPLFSIAWKLSLRRRAKQNQPLFPELAAAVLSSRNEVALIASSIVLGTLLVMLVPEGAVLLLLELISIPDILVPTATVALFVILGQLGVQPALSFLIFLPLINPLLASGIPQDALICAVMAGWALNSATSPFSVPISILARAANLSPFKMAWQLNWPYALFSPLVAGGSIIFAQLI